MIRHAACLTALLALALPAFAGASGTQDTRDRILREVDRRLEQERTRLMESIGRILQEELQNIDPATTPPATEVARQIAQARGQIETQLTQLQDQARQLDQQIYGLQVQLVELRLMERDSALVEEMRANPQEWAARVQQVYQDAFQAITEGQNYLEGAEGFSRVYWLLNGNQNPQAIDLATSSAYNNACGLSLAGQTDAALDWLEVSLARGIWRQTCPATCEYCGGGPFIRHIGMDTDLDNVRQSPRFDQMMARYRQQ